MQPKIKICGITDSGAARLAARCGADFIGLVCEIERSPRCISRGAAAGIAEKSPLPVILLVDKPAGEAIEIGRLVRPHGLQLIGEHLPDELENIRLETGCSIWLPVRIPARKGPPERGQAYCEAVARSGCDTVVLDTLVDGMKGGTGVTCDWALAEKIAGASPVPVFLAGGITPDNAAEACRQVRPAGIDVSSGVEAAPGVKDPAKVEKLVAAIRSLKL